ncbi:MAG: hypothetical protein JWN14_4403 [Chthonomonadales bacterium]|nr:hypothetical protein [Chthonomonadales bacterium]
MRSRKSLHLSPVIPALLWIGCALPATAQDANVPPTDTPPPHSALEGLQVLAGVAINLAGARNTLEYHKLLYKGQMLTEHGQPIKSADTTHQFLQDQPEKSDSPNIQLDFTHGSGTVQQDVLNAFGINKFPLPGINLYPFRSITRVGATLDGKQGNAAFGFETPAIHLVKGVANWIILGANVEGRWKDQAKGETSGLATYRAFLGKAFWVRYARRPFSAEDVLRVVGTKEKLDAWDAKRNATGNKDLDNFIQRRKNDFVPGPVGVVIPPPPDVSTQALYETYIRHGVGAFVSSYSIEPGKAFWIESEGWYDPFNSHSPRFKGMTAIVATLYGNFNATTRSSVQLRYETGYDRAAPDTHVDRLLINLGLNF